MNHPSCEKGRERNKFSQCKITKKKKRAGTGKCNSVMDRVSAEQPVLTQLATQMESTTLG